MGTTSRASSISLTGTFSAFRHRNYRLWFAGQLTSLVGSWMQTAALGFLVFSLTGSTAYLGYVGFISGLPSWLFMLYGGVIADRIPRRTLLIITQSVLMMLAFILAALVITKVVQPWHILVLAFIGGTANAFDTPARQSFVVELVEREDLTNAIAFNGTMFNAGAILGPAVGGVVYDLAGPAWCFNINGISFIAVIIALGLMQFKLLPPAPPRVSAAKAIAEGFAYVRADRLISTLALTVFVVNVLASGLLTLVPAWAVNILHGDVTTNGVLLSARGIGAVIGGLTIAVLSGRGVRGRMWATSSFILPLTVLAFALSRELLLSLALLVVMGFNLITIMNNSNAMVQSRTPDHLRGRVMGLYSLMFMGGGPLGALLGGVLAERTSETFTVLVCGALLLVYAVFIAAARPEVRKME